MPGSTRWLRLWTGQRRAHPHGEHCLLDGRAEFLGAAGPRALELPEASPSKGGDTHRGRGPCEPEVGPPQPGSGQGLLLPGCGRQACVHGPSRPRPPGQGHCGPGSPARLRIERQARRAWVMGGGVLLRFVQEQPFGVPASGLRVHPACWVLSCVHLGWRACLALEGGAFHPEGCLRPSAES